MNTWRVILATIVIFAAGVVTGGLIARHSQQNKTEAPRHNSGLGRVGPPYSAGGLRLEFLRRAQRELILEPGQRERIDKILKDSQARTVQIMEPISAELREEVERTKTEFLAVLSPEQRQRFDELIKKQHRQHEPRRPTFYQPEASNPSSPASIPER